MPLSRFARRTRKPSLYTGSATPDRRTRRSVTRQAVTAFESETATVFQKTSPAHEHIVLYVLTAMVLLSILFVSVTHLDRVVTAPGRVIPTEGLLYIQPYEKAIIRDVRVKVGDLVKAGQTLATLDPTFTNADVAQLQSKLRGEEANFSRLNAEYNNRPYVALSNEPAERLQFAIWQSRQSEYKAAISDFDSRIKNSEATIVKLKHDVDALGERRNVAAELEQMYLELQRKGLTGKEKVLSTTNSRMEIEQQLGSAKNGILETGHTRDALESQHAVYVDQWRTKIANDLVASRKEMEEIRTSLKKAVKLSQLVTINAPSDAIVLKIGRISIGSIAGSGGDPSTEPLFTLVPLSNPLEAEVKVDSGDIGFIKVGDRVEIKLRAYRYLQHGTAKGVIKTISEGAFTTDDSEPNKSEAPFFKVRIKFTDLKLRDVPADFRLIPGMTLDGDIVVGRRTILSYLVEGALRTSSEAMREP